MIPQFVAINVHNGRKHRIRLWIPMVPVYLLLSPLLLLVGLALVVACVVYRVRPIRALVGGWRLMSCLSGVRVEVEQGRTAVLVSIK
jgi:hypothetical protein